MVPVVGRYYGVMGRGLMRCVKIDSPAGIVEFDSLDGEKEGWFMYLNMCRELLTPINQWNDLVYTVTDGAKVIYQAVSRIKYEY